MIIGRLNERQCKNDLLRLLYNRGLIYSLNVFVIGKGQAGKSTGVYYLANRLKQIQRGISRKQATWKEWEYEKFTTTTPQRFVELWDTYENEILVLEEAGEQMNYLEWYGVMARVFSSTTATQGMKKNICFIITPFFDDIVKHARSRMDLVLVFHHRNDSRKSVVVTPRHCRLNWNNFKAEFKPMKNMILQYNSKFIKASRDYTEWLKGFKQDISDKNKELVGLVKKKSSVEKFSEELKADLNADLNIKPVKINDKYKV